jgi:hypothetical protein
LNSENELKKNLPARFAGTERDFSCFHRETEIKLTQEWCRNCRIRYGLIPVPKEAKIEVTPLTLEDMIREMISEEIQAAH